MQLTRGLVFNLFVHNSSHHAVCSVSRALFSDALEAHQPDNKDVKYVALNHKERLKNVSKSLEIYLENLKKHEKMMKQEKLEFENGKRHLANIMGWPSDMIITQNDIDTAIQYLFPSGLTDSKALPVMKPPEEILPKFKKMEFDDECRPTDTLFYTITPNFYRFMSEVNKNTLRLINFHDEQLLSSKISDTTNDEKQLILVGSEFLTKEALSLKLGGERITDDMYASFIMAMNYLISLPFSHFFSSFIMDFRNSFAGGTSAVLERPIFGCKIPYVQVNATTNQRFVDVCGRAKRVMYNVRVSDAGSGKFTIDGNHYSEFRSLLAREILLAPFIITDLLGKLDVSADVLENAVQNPISGSIVRARSVRHGISLALAALFPEHRETLRLAGLLTLDLRKKERSKINQPGARAKWIWKKR